MEQVWTSEIAHAMPLTADTAEGVRVGVVHDETDYASSLHLLPFDELAVAKSGPQGGQDWRARPATSNLETDLTVFKSTK